MKHTTVISKVIVGFGILITVIGIRVVAIGINHHHCNSIAITIFKIGGKRTNNSESKSKGQE